MTKKWALLCLCVIASVTLTLPCYAYIDPGTGSMMLQVILGGVAGVAVIGKLFWQQLVSLFRFSGTSQENQQAHQESHDLKK